MIAIDTNLLVYAQRRKCAEHQVAQRAIERAAVDRRGWGIALPCIAEFWSVVTHPASSGGPTALKDARKFLYSLVQTGGANVWAPAAGFWERLADKAADLNVSGAQVFDLQIALIAQENGATELWSHDGAFANLPGLTVRDPLSSRP